MAIVQGADIKIELWLDNAWYEITCQTTSVNWRWGAPEALGPLTECEGGILRVSLIDPDRDYDPDNPDSPLQGKLKAGLPLRTTVDGYSAWTGVLQTWGWDRDSMIADLNGLDPIGMLSIRALPDRQTLQPHVATSAGQAKFVLDLIQWDVAKRYFPNGDIGIERGNHYVEGSALDALHQIRFAELGRLFPLRNGGIGWTSRAGIPAPAPRAIINCGGVGLTDMWRAMGLGRIRNHIVVSGGYGVYGPQLPADEWRSVMASALDLQMAVPAPGILPQDLWAYTILDALNPPPVLTVLGTILPRGVEVAQILCSEFGDTWTIVDDDAGTPDKIVRVIGEDVTITPDWIEVDSITEDLLDPLPYAHVPSGTGSGYLISGPSSTYSQVRAGYTPVVGTGVITLGQTIEGSGPALYRINEAFIWFDTSTIPVGATIVEASLAGLAHPIWLGSGNPGANAAFTIEARSYTWLPGLSAPDWRPGANLASYPLRATVDTARASADSFTTFQDAGAGLIGAIVKGGQTQFILVSQKTTAGIAPIDPLLYETFGFDFLRLRVKYHL